MFARKKIVQVLATFDPFDVNSNQEITRIKFTDERKRIQYEVIIGQTNILAFSTGLGDGSQIAMIQPN